MWSPHDQQTQGWTVCLTSSLFYGFHMAVAAAPSMLVVSLMRDFGLDAAHVGLLGAAYFYSYAIAQLLIGGVIDRFGPRLCLAAGAVVCAGGTVAFALSETVMFAALARILSGVGASTALASSLKLGAWWLPPRRLGIFAGVVASIGALGAVANLFALPVLQAALGWRGTLSSIGASGVAIALLMWFVVRDAPEGQAGPSSRMFRARHPLWKSLAALATRVPFWMNAVAGALFFLPMTLFADFWGMKFLEQGHAFTEEDAGIVLGLFFLGNAVGGPLIGWLSDRLGRRKLPLLAAQGIAFCVSLGLLLSDDSHAALYGLGILLGLMMGAEAIIFVIAREVTPPGTVGTGIAVTNAFIALIGAMFVPVVGQILDATWNGEQTGGVHAYSLASYQLGLSVIPAGAAVAFLLWCFVPATKGVPTEQ